MSAFEIVAAIFGFFNVYLYVKENVWCFPTGILLSAMYIVVFFQAKLYSDMGLQVIFIILQAYGWYNWLYGGKDKSPLVVVRIAFRQAGFWLLAAVCGTTALGYVMTTYTDAALPYWDANTTILSIIAQYLMAKKILESWLIWVTVDVLCVGIYYVKGLYPTMVLYSLFFILASIGFWSWRKSYLKTRNPEAALEDPAPAA